MSEAVVLQYHRVGQSNGESPSLRSEYAGFCPVSTCRHFARHTDRCVPKRRTPCEMQGWMMVSCQPEPKKKSCSPFPTVGAVRDLGCEGCWRSYTYSNFRSKAMPPLPVRKPPGHDMIGSVRGKFKCQLVTEPQRTASKGAQIDGTRVVVKCTPTGIPRVRIVLYMSRRDDVKLAPAGLDRWRQQRDTNKKLELGDIVVTRDQTFPQWLTCNSLLAVVTRH